MKVFVFEHLCSGCAADDDLSPQLTPMGSAMLSAVVADFQALGAQVSTVLDHRINLSLDGVQVIRAASASQGRMMFETLAGQADTTLVIAPESDGLLAYWIELLESQGRPHCNSSLEATRNSSDKLALYAHLEHAGVPTPVTQVYSNQVMPAFPAIVKPRRGAGSEWTFLCQNANDLQAIPSWEDWIVQPYVKGLPASCSLIVREGVATPLRMGLQVIEGSKRLHYGGGSMSGDYADRCELARQAALAIPGLSGFVGVDMILGEDPTGQDDVVIEINPRVTMSYLGLRMLCEDNLLEAVLGLRDPATLSWKSGAIQFNARGELI